ncbi:MAG: glycosyltransferase family 1 protein [Candidatus Uhrbacteria bacterium]
MKIGIDARMFGPAVGGGGLGRYVEQLVDQLQKQDLENRYVLFLKRENFDTCVITNPNFEKRLADAHWYTAKEQVLMPLLIERERLDLIHFPHWNVPLLCRTPFVVTIHDLILLEQPVSSKTTTRGPLVHWLKRIGYRISLWHAIVASKRIVAVSEYTKSSIGRFFPGIESSKVEVVYEGVTGLAVATRDDHPYPLLPMRRGNEEYVLYVGNAYPHKNLDSLLDAFAMFSKAHPGVELVLAGRDDVFYRRLRDARRPPLTPPPYEEGKRDNVRFVMNPTDAELAELYRGASLYVFPSKSEGFGLPPLEAMSMGIPVASSNATCLPEILGDAATYFSPDRVDEMADAMERGYSDERLRAELIAKGREQIKKYSWAAMARSILNLYGNVAYRETE